MSEKTQSDNRESLKASTDSAGAGTIDGQETPPSLEEILEQLDNIVETLGGEDCTLEQSFALYREGMTLLKNGNERIDQVEKKMLEISKEGELHEFFGGTE